VSVPVIGNGDIASADDAVRMIGNLDGVMVGRGTFGNPWLLKEIHDAFCGSVSSVERTFRDKVPFILEHCEIAVRLKGERRGMLEMRRHLLSYVKGFDGAKELRLALMGTEKFDETRAILLAAA
jgi:tRNA-dihydrouridine synthase B